MELRDLILLKLIKGGSSLVEETATGNPVGFDTEVAKPLKSLVVPLTYSQEGTGDPSPTNIRPISGVSSLFCVHAKKNMGTIRGYSAETKDYSQAGTSSNRYGTALSTTSPESSLVITQSQSTTDYTKNNYRNGYFVVRTDNMVVGQYYDVSIKVTDIISNPLDAGLSNFSITSPNGSVEQAKEVIGNVLIWNHVLYRDTNGRQFWELRNCGMSCTLSEFMVTPAYTNDGVYEAYDGAKLDVVFPAFGKNLYDQTSYPLTQGKWVGGNGGYISTDALYACTMDFIPCEHLAGKEVALNRRPGGNTPGISFYTEALGSTWTESIRNNGGQAGTPWTFTVPSTAKYMRFTVPADTYDIQIELGDTATAYEPYNNSVYGGSLDLVSGVLTITDAFIAAYNGETLPSTWVSDRDVYSQGTNPTTGAQVVYKLATPVTVQLTPAQASAFVGDNTVWTNTTGDLTVKYYDKQ